MQELIFGNEKNLALLNTSNGAVVLSKSLPSGVASDWCRILLYHEGHVVLFASFIWIHLLGNHGNHGPFGFGFDFGDALSTETKTKTKTKPKALWNGNSFSFGFGFGYEK
jgi:hypothetical protein